MESRCIPTGPFEANCYVLWGAARQALVIDPGADPESVLAVLDADRLTVAVYLLTHGHVDHIGALAALDARHPAVFGLHPADLQWAFQPLNELPPFYPVPRRPSGPHRALAHGQSWTDGGLAYSVIATPGHSPGSVCFYFADEGLLVSGDTLFQGTVGRTDLPGGDSRTLAESLRRLARLPPATRVAPGHGPSTTLAREFRANPFLNPPAARS